MSLMAKTPLSTGRGKVRAGAANARRQARHASAQLAPFASSARMTARQGVLGARAWAAPRLDYTGNMLEQQVAPRMSSMLSRAARRIEPTSRRRRRWPFLTAGVLVMAGAAAAAAVVKSRRSSQPFPGLGQSQDETADSQSAEAVNADANGRVHTS